MGEVHVHEFMSLDGVIDAPTWTFEYGFDPKMGEAIGSFTASAKGILLGRVTYETVSYTHLRAARHRARGRRRGTPR